MLSLLDSSGTVLGYSTGAQAAVSLTVETGGRYYALVNDRAFLEGKSFSSAVGKAYQLRARVFKRRGDVDGSGRIDFRDAFLVFLLVQNMTDSLKFTPAQRLAADFNGNGKVLGDLDDFLLSPARGRLYSEPRSEPAGQGKSCSDQPRPFSGWG